MTQTAQIKLKLMHLGIQFSIALLLSLIMTYINYDLDKAFFYNWAKSFLVAFIIIPLAIRLIPLVAMAVKKVVGDCPLFLLRCLVAICVATMMEAIVASAVIFAQYGLDPQWLQLWSNTFIKALPVGLIIGFTMTFIVHPRLQKLALQTH